ncbi:MAG TPA: hypothetical protein VFB28_00390 [Terriglobales bacterium]|nr:hypothetical protein [Terriglobales bacterium]
MIHDTFRGFGANLELGSALYQIFREAGLPGPTMRQEIPLGRNPEIARWFTDTLSSLQPRIQQLTLPLESVGNLDTLAARLQVELDASRTVAAALAPVGAWARII